jgi:hypothetical protein
MLKRWGGEGDRRTKGRAIGLANEIRVANMLGEAVTKYDGKGAEGGEKL